VVTPYILGRREYIYSLIFFSIHFLVLQREDFDISVCHFRCVTSVITGVLDLGIIQLLRKVQILIHLVSR
jgi:hypothetical protein